MSRSENHGRFAWHELLTADPEAAKRFYSDVVGWTPEESQNAPGYTVFLTGAMPSAGLMQTPQGMGTPPMWLGYVEVDDVDATVREAATIGGTLLGDVKSMPGVGRFALLRDPQGATIGVVTSARPLPPETDPTPGEFSWHELITEDLAGGIRFYDTLFGWKEQGEMDMGEFGKYRMFGRDRFTYGGMFKKSPDMPMSTWLYYASVAGTADQAAERGVKLGARIFNGPMDVPGGDRIAALFDPQGAAFAVHSKPANS